MQTFTVVQKWWDWYSTTKTHKNVCTFTAYPADCVQWLVYKGIYIFWWLLTSQNVDYCCSHRHIITQWFYIMHSHGTTIVATILEDDPQHGLMLLNLWCSDYCKTLLGLSDHHSQHFKLSRDPTNQHLDLDSFHLLASMPFQDQYMLVPYGVPNIFTWWMFQGAFTERKEENRAAIRQTCHCISAVLRNIVKTLRMPTEVKVRSVINMWQECGWLARFPCTLK